MYFRFAQGYKNKEFYLDGLILVLSNNRVKTMDTFKNKTEQYN